jgi:hypothetical protein
MSENLLDYKCLFEVRDLESLIEEIEDDKKYIISDKLLPERMDSLKKLLNMSDHVIGLVREDSEKQIESFVHGAVTGTFFDPYTMREDILKKIDTVHKNVKNTIIQVKKNFREFVEENQIKTFTYEELYYGGNIAELKEYLNLNISAPFPYGEKYRTDSKIERLI